MKKIKFCFFGDVHGRDFYKYLFTVDGSGDGRLIIDGLDKVVFVGDYVDTREHGLEIDDITLNLMEIIDLKKKYPDKVVLLLGNHDLYYWFPESALHDCSPTEYDAIPIYKKIFWDNKDLFQIAFQYKNYIATHAGISQLWYDDRFKAIHDRKEFKDLNLGDALNKAWFEYRDGYPYTPKKMSGPIHAPGACLFDCGYMRGGHNRIGGPVWLDCDEFHDIYRGLHQIVGHNRVSKITPRGVKIDENTTLTDVNIGENSKLSRKDFCYFIEI